MGATYILIFKDNTKAKLVHYPIWSWLFPCSFKIFRFFVPSGFAPLMKNVVCRLLQNTRYLVRHTFSVCRDSSGGFFLLKTFVFFLIRTPHFLGQINCYFFSALHHQFRVVCDAKYVWNQEHLPRWERHRMRDPALFIAFLGLQSVVVAQFPSPRIILLGSTGMRIAKVTKVLTTKYFLPIICK